MGVYDDKYRKMSDSELTAAVRDSDDRAFNAIFLRWYPQVANFLTSMVKDRALAEDLAQGVFMKVWIYRENLNPSKSLKNWLLVLARNAALDIFKSKHHLLSSEMHEYANFRASDRTEFRAEYEDTNHRIDLLVEQMPSQRRHVFRMSRYEQLSHQEIALRLGLSVRTVEKHIQLALQDIRKYLTAIGIPLSFFLSIT